MFGWCCGHAAAKSSDWQPRARDPRLHRSRWSTRARTQHLFLDSPEPLPVTYWVLSPSLSKAITNPVILLSALLSLVVSQARAELLISVDWTQQGVSPTTQIGGTWSFGSVTGTTGAFGNSGTVFAANWGGLPFSAGYSTTVNEGISLGGNNANTPQTINFSGPVSSLYLFFNYTDPNSVFDFGTYNWTLVGASKAQRVGTTVVVASDAGNSDQDGFLVNINESFGVGAPLSFSYFEPAAAGDSVAFNLGQGAPHVVPEPGTWAAAALLLGTAGFVRWRRPTTVS